MITDKGPSIVEPVIRTIENLIKKPVFLKGNADWISELPSIVKQYISTILRSTKMTDIEASRNINGKLVFRNFQDQRQKQTRKLKLGKLVRTADMERVIVKAIQQIAHIKYIQ